MRHTAHTTLTVLTALALLSSSGCKRAQKPAPVQEPAQDTETAAPTPTSPAPANTQDRPTSEVAAAPETLPEPQAAATGTGAAAAGANTDYGPVSAELKDPPADLAGNLMLAEVASDFKRPVALERFAGDAERRLFVVEQHVARIRILRPDPAPGAPHRMKVDPEPFFDLKGQVSRGNEQGLLGLAFHPKFAENRRLFVHYTDRDGTTNVVEYRTLAGNPNRVDMSTARVIFTLDQPYSNHNGGNLEFGPDGKLYVGLGDGGAAGDPLAAGQDPKNLLAKMLRFDVDAASPAPEIIQLGLRNPWRYAFDPANGDLYIADVGQNKYEYVFVVAGDNIKGHNFGWNIVEGNQCYRQKNCDKSRFTPAVIVYDHGVGCSITGGDVYRGKAIPALSGVYFYADYCTSIIRSFRWAKDGVRQHWKWDRILNPRSTVEQISSFGVDHDGELYLVSLAGPIYKLVLKRS